MKRSTHIQELGLILDRMERFKLRLNPKKCAFGVTSGKLLGYIISKKGPSYNGNASAQEYQSNEKFTGLSSVNKALYILASRQSSTLHKGIKERSSILLG